VKSPQTALKSVRLAEHLAQTDIRSPPCTLETVGLVEKASGESGIMALRRNNRKLCVFPRKRDLSYERVPNSPFAARAA
jgi:hypothetical protein